MTSVRPLSIALPQRDLDDLTDRLRRTRWPDRETVADRSQGVPLDYLRDLCTYWADGYDWRATERRLNLALNDSPAGLCAWIAEEVWSWSDHRGDLEEVISRDQLLDNVSLYWFTGSAASSARLYWESIAQVSAWFTKAPDAEDTVAVPTACTIFPKEVPRPSRRWAARRFADIRYWGEPLRGGHFGAWEQPEVFVQEIRAGFRAIAGAAGAAGTAGDVSDAGAARDTIDAGDSGDAGAASHASGTGAAAPDQRRTNSRSKIS